jgi:hypothetical protein
VNFVFFVVKKMINNNRTAVLPRRRGLTLTEMMVAVALTIAMLGITGVIFKSASEAAGKAQASNEVCQQLRALTRQLDSDFDGLRPDMPFAVLWEAHCSNLGIDLQPNLGDPDPVATSPDHARWVRYDRIVFFANGDFQVPNGPLGLTNGYMSGNLARIFYGQSFDSPETPKETFGFEPPRVLLSRRIKLLTADNYTNWHNSLSIPGGVISGLGTYNISGSPTLWSSLGVFNYDYTPIENATVAFWKNQPLLDYFQCYFMDYDTTVFPTASFIRRPSINVMGTSYDGVQRLYMLPDVTDFKIELMFPNATEWFPNERDTANFDLFVSSNQNKTIPFYGLVPRVNKFGFFWNAGENPALYSPVGNPACRYLTPSSFPYTLDWRGENGITVIGSLPAINWSNVWPQAIKFTFTLYDKNRRYFPEGQTYSYILKLPPRN